MLREWQRSACRSTYFEAMLGAGAMKTDPSGETQNSKKKKRTMVRARPPNSNLDSQAVHLVAGLVSREPWRSERWRWPASGSRVSRGRSTGFMYDAPPSPRSRACLGTDFGASCLSCGLPGTGVHRLRSASFSPARMVSPAGLRRLVGRSVFSIRGRTLTVGVGVGAWVGSFMVDVTRLPAQGDESPMSENEQLRRSRVLVRDSLVGLRVALSVLSCACGYGCVSCGRRPNVWL